MAQEQKAGSIEQFHNIGMLETCDEMQAICKALLSALIESTDYNKAAPSQIGKAFQIKARLERIASIIKAPPEQIVIHLNDGDEESQEKIRFALNKLMTEVGAENVSFDTITCDNKKHPGIIAAIFIAANAISPSVLDFISELYKTSKTGHAVQISIGGDTIKLENADDSEKLEKTVKLFLEAGKVKADQRSGGRSSEK